MPSQASPPTTTTPANPPINSVRRDRPWLGISGGCAGGGAWMGEAGVGIQFTSRQVGPSDCLACAVWLSPAGCAPAPG
jgi:hypothetical protein